MFSLEQLLFLSKSLEPVQTTSQHTPLPPGLRTVSRRNQPRQPILEDVRSRCVAHARFRGGRLKPLPSVRSLHPISWRK